MTPKKSKETRRQTRRPVQQDELIADAEWHFGKLSNERLIPCFLWEFYREALLKDSILANRVQKIRERFSACGRFLEPVGVRKLRRYWEFYSLCMLPMDVWPSQPFLHQSDEFLSEWKSHYMAVFGEDIEEFHDKLEEQGFPGIRDFQQPLGKYLDRADEPVREFSDTRAGVFSGWVKWPLEVIRADKFTEVVRRQDEDERSVFMQLTRTQPATSKPARGGGKNFNVVVAFSLDFEQSNSALKLQFDTWRPLIALCILASSLASRLGLLTVPSLTLTSVGTGIRILTLFRSVGAKCPTPVLVILTDAQLVRRVTLTASKLGFLRRFIKAIDSPKTTLYRLERKCFCFASGVLAQGFSRGALKQISL